MANPYEPAEELPSIESGSASFRRGTNLLRGIGAACLFGPIGFLIPIVILLIYEAIAGGRFDFFATLQGFINGFGGILQGDLQILFFEPSFGCAVLFSLAGLLNYTPKQRRGIVPSLIQLGATMIVALFVSAIVVAIFSSEVYPYEEVARRRTLVLCVMCTITMICAVGLLAWRLKHDKENTPA